MAGASDNGWSSDGGLPDLPEEWGVIVIPDDLDELSDEVDAIRAELRLAEGPTRWQRLLRRPGVRRLRSLAHSAVRAPVLIISMAVLVTIASLFASAWPGPPRQPTAQRTSSTTDDQLTSLPALELAGADGRTVPLAGKLPAVILLTEGCDCTQLISDTIAAVRPEIAVVTIVGRTTPSAGAGTPPTGATPQAQGKTVLVLHDPSGSVRGQLKVGAPDSTAAVLVVDRNARVVRKLLRTVSIDEFRPDLARL